MLNNTAYLSITKIRFALMANDYQKHFPKQKNGLSIYIDSNINRFLMTWTWRTTKRTA